MSMKKWTYLVAAGMMLSATPVFTGCIDTDEPAGIEELRGAKAELIKARAAVEQAKIAQVQAEAALKQAEAELKLQEAAVKAAEAAYKQALAEAEAARTAEEKAKAEQAIAKAELDAAEAAKAHELAMLKLDTQIAKQQAAYEQALKNLKLAQNTLTQEQLNYLAPYVSNVETAMGNVDEMYQSLVTATENYSKFLLAFDHAKKFDVYLRALKRDSVKAENEYAAALEAETAAKELAENTSDTEAAWAEKLEDLKVQNEALGKELADAKVAYIEYTNSTEFKALSDTLAALEKEYLALTGYKLEAEEEGEDAELVYQGEKFTTEPVLLKDTALLINNLGLDGIIIEEEVKPELVYSDYLWSIDPKNENPVEYKTDAQVCVEDIIARIEEATQTPDQKAWTEQRIKEYEIELASYTENYDKEYARWEALVNSVQNVYGVDGNAVADASKIEGYADLVAATEAYNAAAEKYNTANDAYEKFIEEESAKIADQSDSEGNLAKAIADAEVARDKAQAEAKIEFDVFQGKTNHTVDSLGYVYDAAVAAYYEANPDVEGTADDKVSDDAAVKAAKTAYDTAFEKAYGKADDGYGLYYYASDSDMGKAEAKKIEADKIANYAYDEAVAKAFATYHHNNATLLSQLAALQTAKDEAFNAMKETVYGTDGLQEVVDEFNLKAFAAVNFYEFTNKFYDVYDSELQKNNVYKTADVKEFTGLDYDYVKSELAKSTKTLFGQNEGESLIVTENNFNYLEAAYWYESPDGLDPTQYGYYPSYGEDYGEYTLDRWYTIETQYYGMTDHDGDPSTPEVDYGVFYIVENTARHYPYYARLTPLTVDEMKADIEESWKNYYDTEAVAEWHYARQMYYGGYGYVGKIEGIKAYIEQAKAIIANQTVIDSTIEALEAFIAGIQSQIDAYAAETVKPVEDAYLAKYEQKATELEPLLAAIEAIKEKQKLITPIYEQIMSAIRAYLGYEKDPEGNLIPEQVTIKVCEYEDETGEFIKSEDKSFAIKTIENLKEYLTAVYEEAQKAAYAAETRLIVAKRDIAEAVLSVDLVDAYLKAKVEDAQADYDKANEELTAARTALETAMARIEAGYDPTLEVE